MMNDAVKLGFEFARDLSNQLITLSTGLLAFTVTFSKDSMKTLPRRTIYVLGTAWGLHLLSIAFGILAVMALTGTVLVPLDADNPIGSNARWPAGVQIITFLIGTLLLIVYGAGMAHRTIREQTPTQPTGIGVGVTQAPSGASSIPGPGTS
jgi:hypothetical protein